MYLSPYDTDSRKPALCHSGDGGTGDALPWGAPSDGAFCDILGFGKKNRVWY